MTNWLFSSLMMSPTWTSIHFSLRSLRTGDMLVSGCLSFVCILKTILKMVFFSLRTVQTWTFWGTKNKHWPVNTKVILIVCYCLSLHVSATFLYCNNSDRFQNLAGIQILGGFLVFQFHFRILIQTDATDNRFTFHLFLHC